MLTRDEAGELLDYLDDLKHVPALTTVDVVEIAQVEQIVRRVGKDLPRILETALPAIDGNRTT